MTSASDIRQRLRDEIVAGDLAFGERITIDALATRYQVSHMPVREALRELQGEGLIVIEPNRGARVRTIDARLIENLFEIRIALEVTMVQRAARRCEASDVAELEEIEANLERDIADGNHASVVARNRAFHQTINRMADNVDALPLVDRHWMLLAALWRNFGYGESRFAGVANDHRHLIAALGANDAAAAGLIMGAHSSKAKRALLERVAAHDAPAALRRAAG